MIVNKIEKTLIHKLINSEFKVDNKLLENKFLPEWFKKNRISGEILGLESSWVDRQRKLRLKGLFLLKKISNLFNKNRITYIIMNYSYTIPYVLYDDIDVLIENPLDLLDAVEVLSKEDFNFYDYFNRVYANPLVITAFFKNDKEVGIDFYPEASYGTFQVFDRFTISGRRISKNVTVDESVFKTFLPSREDELMLLATHAFSHGRFTINDVLHGFNIISDYEMDWNYILNTSQRWAIGHILFLYILLVDDFSRTFFGRKLFRNELRIIQTRQVIESNIALEWFLKLNRQVISWPLKLPFRLLYRLATFRAIRLLKMGKDFKGEFIRHMLEHSAIKLFGSRW